MRLLYSQQLVPASWRWPPHQVCGFPKYVLLGQGMAEILYWYPKACHPEIFSIKRVKKNKKCKMQDQTILYSKGFQIFHPQGHIRYLNMGSRARSAPQATIWVSFMVAWPTRILLKYTFVDGCSEHCSTVVNTIVSMLSILIAHS